MGRGKTLKCYIKKKTFAEKKKEKTFPKMSKSEKVFDCRFERAKTFLSDTQNRAE
jgi:hypothetical protein